MAGAYQRPGHATESTIALVNDQREMPWAESSSEASTEKEETEYVLQGVLGLWLTAFAGNPHQC